jgi:ketosteroid isomerase-like protein
VVPPRPVVAHPDQRREHAEVRNLRRDPRLSIVAESGTRGDIRGIAVRGRAAFLADSPERRALVTRLLDKYHPDLERLWGGRAMPPNRAMFGAVPEHVHTWGLGCVPTTVTAKQLLEKTYAAFNARDVDGALAAMHPEVDWPNGLEGGRVHGRRAVREYWVRQWGLIDPRVEPRAFSMEADGRVAVDVRQVVRDRAGTLLKDQMVQHVFRLEDDLILAMEIRVEAGPIRTSA